MKIYIADVRKTATIRIYGVNGTECTRRYFDIFMHDVMEVHETTDEERSICGNEPEYTIDTYELFKAFAGAIGNIQNAIDNIAAAVIREHSIDEYTFESVNYAI